MSMRIISIMLATSSQHVHLPRDRSHRRHIIGTKVLSLVFKSYCRSVATLTEDSDQRSVRSPGSCNNVVIVVLLIDVGIQLI